MCADNAAILPAAFAEAFEIMRDGALILDQQSRVIALNGVARRLFGRPGTQALGQPVDVVLAQSAELLAALYAPPATPIQIALGSGAAAGRFELVLTPLFDTLGGPAGQLATLYTAANQTAVASDAGGSTVWNFGTPASDTASETAALWRAVGFAAGQFLDTAPSGQSLHAALAELGQATHAGRVYVYEYLPNLEVATLTNLQHEWVSPEQVSAQAGTRESAWPLGPSGLSRWQALLSAGKALHGRAADFPEPEQKILAGGSVGAIMLLPIFAGPQWWGVLGFEDQGAGRQWRPAELAALQTTAAILGAAIQLRHTFAALRESEARSRALVNAIPDTILRLTLDGQILDFKSRDAFGQTISPETVIGRPASTWLPPKAIALLPNALEQAAETRQPQTFEYVMTQADQAEFHYEARLVISGPNEVVLMIRDVSERARLEQMKSDFIHRAAHDLRTPLTTASLAASIIQEGGTPEELEQYWKILRNELGRQRELIEELLTLGRLESGTFQLAPGALEVAAFVREAVESVRPLAEKRRVRLAYTIAPNLPRIVGDKNGLLQVLINLLDNAIKFSPPETTVELGAAAQADGVCVRVRDHGMGIPSADIPQLFTRFYRAGNAIRNEVQGTGVGLFIAKAIIDQLNGHISVESELNAGTTFEVWLPRHAEEALQ